MSGAGSIAALLAQRAERHPDRSALVGPTARLTYRELVDDSTRVAGWFDESLKVRPGDRVALLADQTVDAWVVLHGLLRLGAVPVLVNWRLSDEEIRFIVADSECAALLGTEAFTEVASRLGTDLSGPTLTTSEVVGAAGEHSGWTPPPFPRTEDVAVQQYTSGTTGSPKGVCLTNRNLLALMAVFAQELPGFGAGTRQLVVPPLFHIAGFGFGLGGVASGGTSYLLERFEPAATLAAIEQHSITHSLIVPAMLQAVVDVPGAAATDTSSLQGLLYGGSAISRSLLEQVSVTLGCWMTQAYGLTETSGIATMLRYDDHEAGLAGSSHTAQARLASAGRPLLGTEISIRDALGEALPTPGIEGEVWVRNPEMVMPGYWNRSEANSASLTAEGWFRTGDVGRLDDDGYLYLVDRLNDLIVSKGENVFPGEVERVLKDHPGVVDCAVVGIPDERFGEKLCAVVETAAGAALELSDLQAWCRPRLAGFKLPRALVLVDELPRTPSGKVLRRIVREPFWVDSERRIN